MPNLRSTVQLVAAGVAAGAVSFMLVQVASSDNAATDGGVDPGSEVQAAHAAELDALFAEIDRTGLVPIGENGDGTGPVGYVRRDDLSAKAREVHATGKTGEPLPIVDEAGSVVALLVDGYGFADRALWADATERAAIIQEANDEITERNAADDALGN